MATKPVSAPNKFIALRKAVVALGKDIAFLSKCKSANVTPKSHRIRIRTSLNYNRIRSLENEVITHSIRTLRAKLERKTLEAYNLHLKLAQQYPFQFPLFLTKVKVAEECESERKRKILDKKFMCLLAEQKPKPSSNPVHQIGNFVVNNSSQNFTGQQMELLNMGLKYAIRSTPQVEQLVIELEAGINTHSEKFPMTTEQKEQIRNATTETVKDIKLQKARDLNHQAVKTIRELKEKPVFYIKADKGNALVIMDKEDYDRRMMEVINNGPYRKLRKDPLPDLIKRVEKTMKECKLVIGNSNLRVTNPILPRIKGLPKIHKPGNEMREIVSAELSPTHRLAKWLVNQFKGMNQHFESKSVKNSKDFTQHIQSIGQIEEDEIMVSFDVKALFPSIPINEAVNRLESWLKQQHEGPQWSAKIKQYIRLTKLCMEENYFTFREGYYKQLKGAPMGNSLSPFISEIFMAGLESDLTTRGLMPRFWRRYVDDVFAIVKKNDLESTLETLNGIHKDIRFTYEVEKEGRLPFLDILLVRTQRTLELEIYRKTTNTNRVIPNTSQHSYPHKMAAFNHMIHRMLTLPLSQKGLQKETNHILEIAYLNGYANKTIVNLINKKKRTLQRGTLTTLEADQVPRRRITCSFNQHTAALKKKLKAHGLDVVYSSRNNQLGTLLGSTKDPVKELAKPGIYKISCSHCNKVYIGQTRRNLETRLKEHLREAQVAIRKNIDEFRSKVAEHMVSENHPISKKDIQLINHIQDRRQLDVAESIEIYKSQGDTLLNRDQGNGFCSLFRFLNKHEVVPVSPGYREPSSSSVMNASPRVTNIRNSTNTIDRYFTCPTDYAPQIQFVSENRNPEIAADGSATCPTVYDPQVRSVSRNLMSTTPTLEDEGINVIPTPPRRSINKTIRDYFAQSRTH